MKNENFRKALNEYIEDYEIEEDVILLENHTYDNSVIGITEDGRLIYDYEKMIKEFMKDEGCSETEAIEWLEYNTLRAIPYMGERAPIIMYTSVKTIKKLYGEEN